MKYKDCLARTGESLSYVLFIKPCDRRQEKILNINREFCCCSFLKTAKNTRVIAIPAYYFSSLRVMDMCVDCAVTDNIQY